MSHAKYHGPISTTNVHPRTNSENPCSSVLIGAPLPSASSPGKSQNSNFAKRTQQLIDSKRTPQKNEPKETQETPGKTQDYSISNQSEPRPPALHIHPPLRIFRAIRHHPSPHFSIVLI
jgi:hypothetical protein